MKQSITHIIIAVFLIFGVSSCKKEKVDVRSLVEREVELKLDNYIKLEHQRCEESLVEEITLEVDSTMFFLVQKMRGTTDLMPGRPDRPGRLVDTISLERKPEN